MLGDRLRTFAAVLALCLVAGPALADAIDGNWCHNDGRRLSIRGAEIVTPGGLRMEGNYSRHWFTYVVPTAEPGAGQTIFMTLLDEHNVDLRRGEATASPERWVRCSPSVS
jgi:hypothetical protein